MSDWDGNKRNISEIFFFLKKKSRKLKSKKETELINYIIVKIFYEKGKTLRKFLLTLKKKFYIKISKNFCP
jgi:hypothetical protein